jgi:hypothetical protein
MTSMIERLEQRSMFSVVPDPGSTFATAFNIGDLNGQQTFNNTLDGTNLTDVYKFTMPRAGTFFGRLRATTAPASIDLWRETIDSTGQPQETRLDFRIANQSGADGGFTSGDLPAHFLTAGTYYIRVGEQGSTTPYLVRMTADFAGSSLGKARNVGSATDATFRDFIGQDISPSLNDPVDIYKVKMDAPGILEVNLALDSAGAAHVDYIHDVNGNGVIDPGDVMFSTPPTNITLVNSNMPAGTFFVRVVSDIGSVNYHIRLTADYAGSTPDTQRATGSLDNGKAFHDFISTSGEPTDTLDQYQFSVNSTRPLNVVFLENGGTSEVRIIKDRNNDGIPEPDTETILSTENRSFSNSLITIEPGNYFIQVLAATGSGTYEVFAQASPDQAGNTLGRARNLGTVNGLIHREEFVSQQDPVDFYKFTAAAVGTIGAELTPELGDDANLALIRDSNNNGVVDPGEILAASNLPANQTDSFSKSITAGNYFLRVTYNGFEGNTKYLLSFQTDYAGSSTATARNVGSLAGTQSFDDWASGPFGGVISDTSDLYKFNLTSARTLVATMTGKLSGQDLDLQLYVDKIHDGKLTANELIASSSTINTANEQITKLLAAGTYFLRVAGLNGETNYHLTMNA